MSESRQTDEEVETPGLNEDWEQVWVGGAKTEETKLTEWSGTEETGTDEMKIPIK